MPPQVSGADGHPLSRPSTPNYTFASGDWFPLEPVIAASTVIQSQPTPSGIERSSDGRSIDSSLNDPSFDGELRANTCLPSSNGQPFKEDRLSTLTDLFLFATPVLFLALMLIIISKHNQPIDSSYQSLRNATQVASTLSPLAFAAVVGQGIKQLTRRQLERGSSMGVLEQLSGSRTVFGAVTTQFTLLSSTTLAVLLVLTWALSPIGGQASVRSIYTGYRTTITEPSGADRVSYLDTRGQPVFSGWWNPVSTNGQAVLSGQNAALNSLYNAALFALDDVKQGSMDTWGNVKVPYLLSASKYDDWVDISADDNKIYSSLVGIPMTQFRSGSNRTLYMESTYLELDCGKSTLAISEKSPSENIPLPVFTQLNDSVFADLFETYDSFRYKVPNGMFQGLNGKSSDKVTWAIGLDRFVDHSWYEKWSPGIVGNKSVSRWEASWDTNSVSKPFRPEYLANETKIEATQAPLLFQSHDVWGQMYTSPRLQHTQYWCKLTQRYVENLVNCTGGTNTTAACIVTAQRLSRKPHANENFTAVSWPQIFHQFSVAQPLATGQNGQGDVSDPALCYINNTASSALATTDWFAVLDDLDPKVFSQRFGQILNSYLHLGQAFTSIASPEGQYFQNNVTVGVTKIETVEIYKVSLPWVLLLALAIVVMFLAAISSIVMRHRAHGPDILGYCSLAVRDSEHVELPPGLGPLEDKELTKKIGNERNRFGVVSRAKDGTGTLGTARASEVEAMKKGERYL